MKLIITNPFAKTLFPLKYIVPLAILLAVVYARVAPSKNRPAKEKTASQIADARDERCEVCSDEDIVYGIHDARENFAERAKSRDKGEEAHFMTEIAWEQHKDYVLGQYEAKTYFDEKQQKRNGDITWHGENAPYIVPSDSRLNYLKNAKPTLAGVTAIPLEEPEFWAEDDYGDAFKKEREKFYRAPQRPHENPGVAYQSSKLKRRLYRNALRGMFKYKKACGKQTGKQVLIFF